MKFLRNFILASAIVLSLVHFGGNYLLSNALERWLGVEVSVSCIRWGFSNHHFSAKKIILKNPSGYASKNLAEISEVNADYSALDLRSGIFKIKRLEIKINEINLERNAEGESNVSKLNAIRRALRKPLNHAHSKSLPLVFKMDRVQIDIDRIFFEKQTANGKTRESRNVNLSEKDLNELKTPDNVVRYIVYLAFQSAGWEVFFPLYIDEKSDYDRLEQWLSQLRAKTQKLPPEMSQMVNDNWEAVDRVLNLKRDSQ